MPTTADVLDLGYRPRPWQAEVHRALKRFSVLVCHRRAGKTVLAVMELLHRAIECPLKRPRYAYLAPKLKQAKKIAWPYLCEYGTKIPGAQVNKAELTLTLPNGAAIQVDGVENADAHRGVYLDGLVLDEVAQIAPETWEDVLQPTLTDREGWAVFCGTPRGVNLFSEMYHRARSSPDWYAKLLTVRDTGALKDTEVARLEREMAPKSFAREYLCDFSVAAPNQLLSMTDVDTAMQRVVRPGSYEHMPLIFGLDVAREGDDDTCLIKRRGCYVQQPLIMRGDGMQIGDRVAMEIEQDKPDAVFIDVSGGYGAGPYDRLKSLGHRCIPIQFGGSPGDSKYLNKRSEMWWLMSLAVKESLCLPRHPRLMEDLTGLTYEHNAKDQLVLESKDDLRARGLPSPDVGDALALTYAAPVRPPDLAAADERFRQSAGGQQRQQYDPLARTRRRMGV